MDTKTPLQAMKDWHKLKPKLFRKRPYYLPGCDIYAAEGEKIVENQTKPPKIRGYLSRL